jgi:hypothetical protein
MPILPSTFDYAQALAIIVLQGAAIVDGNEVRE